VYERRPRQPEVINSSTGQCERYATIESFHETRDTSVNFRNAESTLAQDPRKIEANSFAAALPMLAAWIYAAVEKLRASKRRPSEEKLVSSLATTLAVSELATRYRLLNFRLIASSSALRILGDLRHNVRPGAGATRFEVI